MSVEDKDKIDAISLSNDSDKVILTITYHLDWTEENLFKLQEKINTYLSFIESGEMLEAYPQSKGKYVLVEVVYSKILDENGLDFVTQAKSALDNAGYELKFSMVEDIS